MRSPFSTLTPATLSDVIIYKLVPAVGDDDVSVGVTSTWCNDRSASIVPNVATEVRNVCPIVLRTNEVGSLRTIDRLVRVVSIRVRRRVLVAGVPCRSASRCCKGDCS